MVVVLSRSVLVALLAAVLAAPASASSNSWAAPQIRIVTQAGVLGSSPSAFAPAAPLTESALADALAATDALQHPPLPATADDQPHLRALDGRAERGGGGRRAARDPGAEPGGRPCRPRGRRHRDRYRLRDALPVRARHGQARRRPAPACGQRGLPGRRLCDRGVAGHRCERDRRSPDRAGRAGAVARREVVAPCAAGGAGPADGHPHALPGGFAGAARVDQEARRGARRLPRARQGGA